MNRGDEFKPDFDDLEDEQFPEDLEVDLEDGRWPEDDEEGTELDL
jgi:hypothetical protein